MTKTTGRLNPSIAIQPAQLAAYVISVTYLTERLQEQAMGKNPL